VKIIDECGKKRFLLALGMKAECKGKKFNPERIAGRVNSSFSRNEA
jgi:hypothetical protein